MHQEMQQRQQQSEKQDETEEQLEADKKQINMCRSCRDTVVTKTSSVATKWLPSVNW